MKRQEKKEMGTARTFVVVAGIVAGVVVASVFFFYPPKVSAENFKVGFIAPLSGPYATEAGHMKMGAMMAVDEINAKGGVLGRKVDLIARDDRLNPAEGERKAKELVEQEGVKYIAGALSSAVQMAINNYTKQVKVMYVSLSASDEIVKVPDFSNYTFHEYMTVYMINYPLGNYAFNNKLGKKFYILLADYGFGHQNLADMSKVINARGGEIIGTARHPLGTSDFTTFLPKILAAKPDILYLANYGKDQINFLKQAFSFGFHKQMRILTAGTSLTMAKEIGPEAMEGVYSLIVFYWELEDSIPQAKKANQEFRKRAGMPLTEFGATGYSGVLEMLEGINRAGTDNVEQVIKAMEGHEYSHYKGPQKWRKCDHQSIQDVYVYMGKKRSEITREWDLFKIVDKGSGEGIMQTCAELGHK